MSDVDRKNKGEIRIGTSGWDYPHWKGSFYPERMPADEVLPFYVARFRAAEVNNTFYQLPDEKTVVRWYERTPGDFVFACKASRYITHMKKLKEPVETLASFLKAVGGLKNKLGPILFQLPPRWHCNLARLRAFLEALPEGCRYAFEFRDESWFGGDTCALLKAHGAAFCIYDIAGRRSPREVTADFVYVRLHGPSREAYRGRYSTQALAGWAGALSSWSRQERDVFCFFDNDERGYAAQNALRLREMLES